VVTKNPSNLVHLTLPKSQPRSSINNLNMNCRHVFRTLSNYVTNHILLSGGLLFTNTPRIVFSSTTHYFVAMLSRYCIQPCTIFTLIFFSLHSQLHFIKHGIYGQPGEESLLTEESRSTPSESICRCMQEYSQASLRIKYLNFRSCVRG
jgi:hypothetical protein